MMKRGRAKPKHVCPVGGIIGMICGTAALCFGVAVAISVIGDIGGVMRSLFLTIAFSCSAAGLSGAAGGLIAFFRDAEVGAVAEMVAAEFSIVLCVILPPVISFAIWFILAFTASCAICVASAVIARRARRTVGRGSEPR